MRLAHRRNFQAQPTGVKPTCTVWMTSASVVITGVDS